MQLNSLETVLINGQNLKRRIQSSVNDFDAMKLAARNPDRYRVPSGAADSSRPNMFKARDAAMAERMQRCDRSDPWVREIIAQWCALSLLPPAEADFWQEHGFMGAIRAGRDLQIRRFLDDDGWAWIVVRDIPSYWIHRRRLPEATRQQMMAAMRRKKEWNARR